MTPTEIIALIFAIIILIKAIFVPFVSAKWLMNLVKKMFSNSIILSICFTVIAVVLGYFLLQELSIVQIMASSLFGLMLFALIMAAYPKGYLKLADVVVKDKKKAWFASLVFLVLALWVLYALFF